MKTVNPSLAFIITCYFSHSTIIAFAKKEKTTGQHIFVTSFNLVIRKQSKKQGLIPYTLNTLKPFKCLLKNLGISDFNTPIC